MPREPRLTSQQQEEEKAKERKKQIQAQFVQRLKHNKETNQHPLHPQVVRRPREDETVKEERAKRKRAETKLEKQKQYEKQLQEKTKDLQKKYDVLKEKHYQEKQKNEELTNLIATLQEENKRLLAEKEAWFLSSNPQQNAQYEQEIKKLVHEKRQLRQKNQAILTAKKQQQSFIQQLQRKIKLLEAIKSAETPRKNEEKIRHVQRELHFYKQKLAQVEQNFTAHSYIEKLYENLTLDTVDQYLIDGKNPFGPLGAEVSKVWKKQKEWEQRTKTTPKQEHPTLFGYIGKTKDGWVFFDLNYHSFAIESYPKELALQEEKPAKAELTHDKTVKILHTFDMEPTEMQQTRQKRKQNVLKAEKGVLDYPNFGAYHVLIIGSRNQKSYTDRLNKHGLSVQWHNPFEEGYKRLGGRYQKADAVIVCTRHIPHSVLDHIDKKEEKVEFLERDNEEMLASRVAYVLERIHQTNT